MDTLVQWELDQSGVALSADSEIAGTGGCEVRGRARRRLLTLQIVLGDDVKGDYSAPAHVCDHHGNLLTLATPHSRPCRPA